MPAAPLRPVGGPAQLHFHSKRWCGTHGGRAQRHQCWFRAPARADRRSAFPGLRAALPGRGSARLHFHSKRWCGTHGGRASRHQQWFRAPARCRPEVGVPVPAAPLRPVGGPAQLHFHSKRWCALTAALMGGRARPGSVISAGFALPRDADRRSAFPGLRAALPGGGSAQLHFHSKRWCGTHGGRAQRHRRGFRAPARADRRSAFPGLRAALPGGGSAQLHFHSKRWCATYGGRAQRHERWFRAPARCRSETGAPSRPRARSRSAVRGFAALWAAVPV